MQCISPCALPNLTFQPSDPDPAALASIAAWAKVPCRTCARPLRLDATAPRWPVTAADAILCINMIHIAPWAATEGLIRQAAQLLPAGSAALPLRPLIAERRAARTASNAVFDDSLRERNPKWGLRELDAVGRTRKGGRLRRAAGDGNAGEQSQRGVPEAIGTWLQEAARGSLLPLREKVARRAG
jgi:hypothetical protein